MEILDQTLIPVVFKLTNFKCPKNKIPAITGDIYELGEWELDGATIATPLIYEGTDSEAEDDDEEDEKEGDKEEDGVKANNVKEHTLNEKENDVKEIDVKENGVKENDVKENDLKENGVKENDVKANHTIQEIDAKEGYNDTCGYEENDENENGEGENDDQIWLCEVKVPIATEFEWNWALVSRDETRTTFFKVERTVRRKDSVGYFKKTIPSKWEKDSFHLNHIPVEACDVKISLLEKTVYKDQMVCLLGSVPVMGCWIPTRSILATRLSESPDQWGVQFKLPRKSRPVYWKWAVINIKTQKIEYWEGRVNRILYVGADYLALRSIWNENGEARVISNRDYPKVAEKSKCENKVKLTKPVRDPDLTQPPALYYEMMREIYKIYTALRPDGSYQYRRYKNLASVEEFPKLYTLVDITSNILLYKEAIVFQVTDGGGKRNGFQFAFRGSEFVALSYPDPESLTEVSFSWLMKYCSGGPYYQLGQPIVPYENQTTKKDKMTSWVKRSFYNKETNIKIEYVLKPEADYLCIRPADIPPHILCAKHSPHMKPKADADNCRELIPQSVLKEKEALNRSGDQAVPTATTKVTKGTQTRWTNRPSINQAKAASANKHKHDPEKESTKCLRTAETQTDTEGLHQTDIHKTKMKGLCQPNIVKSEIKAVPPTEVTKGTQTRWTTRPPINQAKYEHKHVKESTIVLRTAEKQTDTEGLQEANVLTAETVHEEKTRIENGKGNSLYQSLTEKATCLYQMCTNTVTDEWLNQTDAKEKVIQNLYQTDVDTGKGERFYEKNITNSREGLIHIDTDAEKNEDSNDNAKETVKHQGSHETKKDTGKRGGFFSRITPSVFNIAVLTLRNVFI